MNTRELEKLIEYKFAPGPLLAVQGLANTYSFEDGEELLGSPGEARDWLVATGLAEPSIRVTPAEHEELLEFRTLVRSMLERNLDGDEGAVDEDALARFTANRPVPITSAGGGGVELDLGPASSVGELIGQQLGIVLRAQLEGDWERLKICAADSCRWAFYDFSRNRGGHWCSMEMCGNREKNRRYRGRRAGAADDA
jgi:predicted RNA-binding Zn ribbon-like protein